MTLQYFESKLLKKKHAVNEICDEEMPDLHKQLMVMMKKHT